VSHFKLETAGSRFTSQANLGEFTIQEAMSGFSLPAEQIDIFRHELTHKNLKKNRPT
jgi:hypothetical protein